MAWLPTLSKQQLEERRREAARLLRQGQLSQAEIARELGVSRTAVCHWAKQLERQGLRGLAARVVSGRPAQMNQADWRKLLALLKRGAKRAGFPTERWTLIRIQLVIWRELGCAYSLPHIWRQLRRLDWSPQCPIARASERDDELVEAWLKHDWPRIKKGASARRNHCIY